MLNKLGDAVSYFFWEEQDILWAGEALDLPLLEFCECLVNVLAIIGGLVRARGLQSPSGPLYQSIKVEQNRHWYTGILIGGVHTFFLIADLVIFCLVDC